MERKVDVVETLDGKKIVFIHDIILYDIMNVKKNEQPFLILRPYSVKNPFL